MTQRLFIPSVGDIIELAENWTFDLYRESRNETFGERIGCVEPNPIPNMYPRKVWVDNLDKYRITLDAHTPLKVARIYIKQGGADYDSITFSIPKMPGQPYGRFWVKLRDVNRIVMKEKIPQILPAEIVPTNVDFS
jgi:hypothetical protein